jgi:hypothetical protein
MKETFEKNRAEELHTIMKWIDKASYFECTKIIEEIRCCHDNLMAWNPETKLLAKIESVCINGEAIQLNIEVKE